LAEVDHVHAMCSLFAAVPIRYVEAHSKAIVSAGAAQGKYRVVASP
jgi:hypothetical protein